MSSFYTLLGDAKANSDWDVLAIVDKPRLSLEDRGNLQYLVWDKGLDMGEEINVFSYTKRQWSRLRLRFLRIM